MRTWRALERRISPMTRSGSNFEVYDSSEVGEAARDFRCWPACMLRKRSADAADLNRCILRSRRRTTLWEFSARLCVWGRILPAAKILRSRSQRPGLFLGAITEAAEG